MTATNNRRTRASLGQSPADRSRLVLTLNGLSRKPVLKAFVDVYSSLTDVPARREFLELALIAGFEQIRIHYQGGLPPEALAGLVAVMERGLDPFGERLATAGINDKQIGGSSTEQDDVSPPAAPKETVRALQNLLGRTRQ